MKSTHEHRRVCQPGEDSDTVKIDKEFEGLIPPLSASELADLHRSIDAEGGCRDALVVWKGHDTLVDGHNRIKHCREKGYPFPVVEREFDGREQVKAYIIETQLGRRNLSPAAESYLRGKRYLAMRHQGKKDEDATSGQSDPKRASEKLGEEFKVGEKTIRRDGKFAEAVDVIVEACGHEARNLILARETGLTRGGVLRLSRLKPEEQKRFVEELKESGRPPRKARKKAGRRDTIVLPTRPKAIVNALVKQLDARELAEVARALAAATERQEGEEQKGGRAGGRKARKRPGG